MAYRIVAILMTLGYLQSHYLSQAFSNGIFRSCICAAFDKISTDSASRGPSAIAEHVVFSVIFSLI